MSREDAPLSGALIKLNTLLSLKRILEKDFKLFWLTYNAAIDKQDLVRM